MSWLWNILNFFWYRIHCFYCDKLVNYKANVIKYKVRDNSALQKAYVCESCSLKLFIEKEQAEKLQQIYDGDLSEEEPRFDKTIGI
jgi:uncharacterized protein YlaI